MQNIVNGVHFVEHAEQTQYTFDAKQPCKAQKYKPKNVSYRAR
jgi:hypothetical protein